MKLFLTLPRKTPKGFIFKFDLDALLEMLEDYLHTELWSFLTKPPPGLEVHFVRAERSERW